MSESDGPQDEQPDEESLELLLERSEPGKEPGRTSPIDQEPEGLSTRKRLLKMGQEKTPRRGHYQPIVQVIMDADPATTKIPHESGDQTGEHPRGVLDAKRKNPILKGTTLVLKTEKMTGGRMNREVEISILEVDRDRPILWRDGGKNGHKSLHTKVLRGNKDIDSLQVEDCLKTPGTFGNNKDRGQRKRRVSATWTIACFKISDEISSRTVR